jgi:hypothetical protein
MLTSFSMLYTFQTRIQLAALVLPVGYIVIGMVGAGNITVGYSVGGMPVKSK